MGWTAWPGCGDGTGRAGVAVGGGRTGDHRVGAGADPAAPAPMRARSQEGWAKCTAVLQRTEGARGAARPATTDPQTSDVRSRSRGATAHRHSQQSAQAPAFSIRSRRLRGRMSVHTSSTYEEHSAYVPSLPTG